MKLRQVISMYVLFRESTGRSSTGIEAGLKAFCQIMGKEIDITEVDAEKGGGFSNRNRPTVALLASPA